MRAFVYIENPQQVRNSSLEKPTYTIQYSSRIVPGCNKMQSTDEEFFQNELINLQKNKVILIEKIPSDLRNSNDGIERKPYDLSSLLKTSACH